MLGKLKKILGIEGVKLSLIVDEQLDLSLQEVVGTLRFTSKTDGEITSISIKLVEKYSRGRRKNKMTDEYTIGEILLTDGFKISSEEIIEIPFNLPFHLVKSPMDHLGEKNIFYRGITFLAKKLKDVKSEYTLVAEAEVKGTTLHPFDKRIMKLV